MFSNEEINMLWSKNSIKPMSSFRTQALKYVLLFYHSHLFAKFFEKNTSECDFCQFRSVGIAS